MKVTYRKAEKKDAGILIDIYNAAFYDDYIKYGECPAYGRTKEKMELSIINTPKLIIMVEKIPAGVLSFESLGKGVYSIGCFCIIPEYQGIGIGTQAFQHFLTCFDWRRIELITPADKEQNIRFYTQRCGFKIGNTKMDGNVEVVNFYMER